MGVDGEMCDVIPGSKTKSMLQIICGLAVAGAMAGCALVGLGQGERPELVVHGTVWNAPLLNPHPPEYGDGKPGGCIVQGEFRVEIDQLAYDPATGQLHLAGRLLEPRGPEGRWGVMGVIHTRNEAGIPVSTVVSPNTPFSLDVVLAQNPVLEIAGIGFRTLQIDLRTLRRRAALVHAASGPDTR